MGHMRIEILFVLLLLVFLTASVAALGESYDPLLKSEEVGGDSDSEESEKNNLRGLSWFGFGGASEDTKEEDPKPDAPPVNATAVNLIETVPCEPIHERAVQFVALFGDIHSGNEACAAEADPDSCSKGCCRFGTYFLCDTINAFKDLPCVCNRNTAANHPHEGHLHDITQGAESGTLIKSNNLEEQEKEDNTTNTESVDSTKDGEEGSDSQGEKKDIVSDENDDEKEKRSKGIFAAVLSFFEGNGGDEKEEDAKSVSAESNSTSSIDEDIKAEKKQEGNLSSGSSDEKKEEKSSGSTDEKKEETSSGNADEKKDENSSGNSDEKKEETSSGSSDEASFALGWGGPPPDHAEQVVAKQPSNTTKTAGSSSSSGSSVDSKKEEDPHPDVYISHAGVNEAFFTLGWGGPPPDYDSDPGASKHHGTPAHTASSTLEKSGDGFFGFLGGGKDSASTESAAVLDPSETTNDAEFLSPRVSNEDHSNRVLVEEKYDYDHGPINEAVFLTGWG